VKGILPRGGLGARRGIVVEAAEFRQLMEEAARCQGWVPSMGTQRAASRGWIDFEGRGGKRTRAFPERDGQKNVDRLQSGSGQLTVVSIN